MVRDPVDLDDEAPAMIVDSSAALHASEPLPASDSVSETASAINAGTNIAIYKENEAAPVPKLTPAELSEIFDARRPIRAVLPDSHTLTIPMRLLNAELTCVVCLGIIRDCTSVTMCLHRFCSTCIKDSLRLGKKECPQCRVACPSKRNLRPDPVFDAIILSIYPDIEKAEQAQDSMVQSIIDSTNITKLAEVAIKGFQKQGEKAKEKILAQQQQRTQSAAGVRANKQKQQQFGPVLFNLQPHSHLRQYPAMLARFSLNRNKFRAEKLSNIEIVRQWLRIKMIDRWQPPATTAIVSRETDTALLQQSPGTDGSALSSPPSAVPLRSPAVTQPVVPITPSEEQLRDCRIRILIKTSDLSPVARTSVKLRWKKVQYSDIDPTLGTGLIPSDESSMIAMPDYIEIGGETQLYRLRELYWDKKNQQRITFYYDVQFGASTWRPPVKPISLAQPLAARVVPLHLSTNQSTSQSMTGMPDAEDLPLTTSLPLVPTSSSSSSSMPPLLPDSAMSDC